MKRILLLCLFLSLCAFMVILGGCAGLKAENVPQPSATVQQETTVCLPTEADVFSFIVPGKTTIQEVIETISYPADDVLATNHMFICYHLPDGIDALIYFDHQTLLVTEVLLEIPDGSRVILQTLDT